MEKFMSKLLKINLIVSFVLVIGLLLWLVGLFVRVY